MTLGEKLKKLRKERGLAQATVARYIGVTDGTYRKYESDKVFPRNLTLHNLAKCFEVEFEDLLSDRLENDNESMKNKDIIKILNCGACCGDVQKILDVFQIKSDSFAVTFLNQDGNLYGAIILDGEVNESGGTGHETAADLLLDRIRNGEIMA